jgi:hypothetical protein
LLRCKAEGGGQGCVDQCRGWDRCTTRGIPNVDQENQCDWGCLSVRGACSPPGDAEIGDCCSADEIAALDASCVALYHNVSNVDSDRWVNNPPADHRYNPDSPVDDDRIADVCERAQSTKPEARLDAVAGMVTVVRDGPPYFIEVAGICDVSQVKLEFGLFGGNTWLEDGSVRYEMSETSPTERLFEVGACGCDDSWDNCSRPTRECRETEEAKFSDPLQQAWLDIETSQCRYFGDLGTGTNSPLCNDKVASFGRDEDCSHGSCNVHELVWQWGDDPNFHPGQTIKLRVGVREFGQTWQQNTVYTTWDPITLPPEPFTNCRSPVIDENGFLTLDQLEHAIPHEAPNLPLGGWMGAWAIGHDAVSKELHVYAFDKQMRGPLNPRRLAYASETLPRIETGTYAVATGRIGSHLFNVAGDGVEALFVVGQRSGDGPVPGGDPTHPPEELPRVLSLWVAGLEDGLDTLTLAEDRLGPTGRVVPPAMAAPQAVWDRTLSRLVVAGGGESGQFGIWTYTPSIGKWRRITTELPPDLTGFALVADPGRHRLLLLGGRSGGIEVDAFTVVDPDSGLITSLYVHGDRLYVGTVARRLLVYALDRAAGEQRVADLALAQVPQRIRAHGRTVHVGELSVARYVVCQAGGPCDQGGVVEVLRWGASGDLTKVGSYAMGAMTLPYLELAGDVAVKPAAGGVAVYRVEAAP